MGGAGAPGMDMAETSGRGAARAASLRAMDAKVRSGRGLRSTCVIAGLAIHGSAARGAARPPATRARCGARRPSSALFLVSYVLKLAFLGREALSTWSAVSVNVLRFHELCVLAMLLAGGTALFLGRRLAPSGASRARPATRRRPPRSLRRHRLAGRTALVGAILGAATAAPRARRDVRPRRGFLDAPALARAESPPSAP